MQSASRSRPHTRLLVLASLVTALAGCAGATYDTHDDLTVSTHVKIAFLDDVRLGAFRLDASTLHGVVTLSGTVPSQGDVDRAIAVASKVRGVKAVKSDLKIASSPQLLAPPPLLAPGLPVLRPDPIACDAESRQRHGDFGDHRGRSADERDGPGPNEI